jgi:acyl carrier protein
MARWSLCCSYQAFLLDFCKSKLMVYSFHSPADYRCTIPEAEQGKALNTEALAASDEQIKQLADYILEKVLRNKAVEVTADTPLVSSGLIDSFALIEVFLELQKIAGRKIPASKVQTKDMDTVRLMFAAAEKFGKPVKN